MNTQPNELIHKKVNSHGTPIKQITVSTPERVTEFFYQFVMGKWVPYKRVVHSMH